MSSSRRNEQLFHLAIFRFFLNLSVTDSDLLPSAPKESQAAPNVDKARWPFLDSCTIPERHMKFVLLGLDWFCFFRRERVLNQKRTCKRGGRGKGGGKGKRA
jgi:hypothetical protein